MTRMRLEMLVATAQMGSPFDFLEIQLQ